MNVATRRMIVNMMDANHISERLASMRHEMNDLRVMFTIIRSCIGIPHTPRTRFKISMVFDNGSAQA